MNKTDLISSLSEETSFSKKDISKVIEAWVRVVERSLKKGEKVSIAGFGTFGIIRRPARKGINPSTKERISIPAITVAKFKAGKSLRESVRSTKI
ncbi:MAG TPA: HU family DNA-binding protein [Candidatus Babeliales bacterium]|nr:HU family DNA-binding protein [Candidatus Babeliales bacterium]